jgi:hypothetical protein
MCGVTAPKEARCTWNVHWFRLHQCVHLFKLRRSRISAVTICRGLKTISFISCWKAPVQPRRAFFRLWFTMYEVVLTLVVTNSLVVVLPRHMTLVQSCWSPALQPHCKIFSEGEWTTALPRSTTLSYSSSNSLWCSRVVNSINRWSEHFTESLVTVRVTHMAHLRSVRA